MAMRELGIAVVQHLHRCDAFRLVGKIGRMVRRKDLPSNPGLIHQPKPALDVFLRIREGMAGHAALDRQMGWRREPIAHERAEISRRVMGMHIDDHDTLPTVSRGITLAAASSRRPARACRGSDRPRCPCDYRTTILTARLNRSCPSGRTPTSSGISIGQVFIALA